MAKMIPVRQPSQIKNYGERDFYLAAQKLPKSYTVVHSFPFQLMKRGVPVKYEADFIIFHPERGVVVVEVKTGFLVYREGRWLRQGDTVEHRGPDDQLEDILGYIRDRFAELAKIDKRQVPFNRRGVICFPHASNYSGDFPPGYTRDTVWLKQDLHSLEAVLNKLLPPRLKMSQSHQDILVRRILSPSLKLTAQLAEEVKDFHRDGQVILNDEQIRFLESTSDNSRMLVLGGAGTGKSFIAVEKSKQLARGGKRVFATWYSVKLMSLYRAMALPPNVIAAPFTEYLLDLARDLKVEPPLEMGPFGGLRHTNDVLPAWALEYLPTLPERERFDGIVVDEAQDFQPEWIRCLELLLKPGGIFYLFADPAQNIFNTPDLRENPAVANFPRYQLRRNLRNAMKIAEEVRKVEPAAFDRTMANFPGSVEILKWESPAEELENIERKLKELLGMGVKPEQITILTFDRRHDTALANVEQLAGVSLSKEPSDVDLFLQEVREDVRNGASLARKPRNEITITSIRRFKGLESDVVFIVGATNRSDRCTRTDFYVGASRARYLLIVSQKTDWRLPPA